MNKDNCKSQNINLRQQKRKILQILPNLNSGGVERGVIDISKELQKRGFASFVASNGGILVSALENQNIKHFKLNTHSKNPLKIYKTAKELAKIIVENKIDLIHIRSRIPAIISYLALKITQKRYNYHNCKSISTIHGPYSITLINKKPSKLKLFYNSFILKPNYIIAVSDFIKSYIYNNYASLIDLKKKNIVTIHRGVDLDYFCPKNINRSRIEKLITKYRINDDKKIIMLPARITSWKGHEFLIRALKKIKNNNFICLMVGSDFGHKKYMQYLNKMIKDYGLEEKIKFIGQQKDMPATYLLADIVISSSIKEEAFGRISIEAGSMQKIVIATNIGGSLETIIDNKTGFLITVNDCDSLANRIEYILEMKQEEKDKIGNAARNHIVENFSNQKMFDQTIDFYNKIFNEN